MRQQKVSGSVIRGSVIRGSVLAALAGMAGSAWAQPWSQEPTRSCLTSPDGEPLWASWTIAPGQSLRVGDAPRTGTVDALGPELFAPAGVSPEADSHTAAAFLPDGSAVVVANRFSNNLVLLNPDTRALVRNIPLSGTPQALAITADGSRAVTANITQGTASIVNLATGVELAVLPVGTNPSQVLLTGDGARAVVRNFGSSDLTIINLGTLSVERTVPGAPGWSTFAVNFESQGLALRHSEIALAGDIAVVPDGSAANRVRLVNILTGAVTDVPCAGNAYNAFAYANGTRALVTHAFSTHTVSVVDVPNGTILQTYTTTGDLQGPVAVSPDGARAVLAIQNACVVLDLASGVFSPNLTATANVDSLVNIPGTNLVFTLSFPGAIVSYDTQSVTRSINNFVLTSIGAATPTRVVGFSQTFGEDMVVGDPTASLLSAGPSGPSPEADKTRTLAISPDGSRIIAVNQFSQNVTIFDRSGTQLAILPVGRRPGNVQFTPDGTRAVVASRDDFLCTIIDMGALSATNVSMGRRGDQIRISPNGQYAYLPVVADGDGIYRVNLGTKALEGAKISTGNMGGYSQNFSSTSGMALSPDGGTIVTCDSFDSTLTFINAGPWTFRQTLSLGTGVSVFPVRALFNQAGTRLYVTGLFSNELIVVDTSTPTASVLTRVPIPPLSGSLATNPAELALSPSGDKLYVQVTGTPSHVRVVSLPSLALGAAISPSDSISGFVHHPSVDRLYLATSGGGYTIGNGGLSITQSGSVLEANPTSGAILSTRDTGRLNTQLAMSGNGAVLALADILDEGISIVATNACYPNCDGNTTPPLLSAADFVCFLGRFRTGDLYANCDGSTSLPLLTAADFVCYLGTFRAGCP